MANKIPPQATARRAHVMRVSRARIINGATDNAFTQRVAVTAKLEPTTCTSRKLRTPRSRQLSGCFGVPDSPPDAAGTEPPCEYGPPRHVSKHGLYMVGRPSAWVMSGSRKRLQHTSKRHARSSASVMRAYKRDDSSRSKFIGSFLPVNTEHTWRTCLPLSLCKTSDSLCSAC